MSGDQAQNQEAGVCWISNTLDAEVCEDALNEYGPHKTLYTRWKRWSDKGIFARIMAGFAAEHGEKTTVMIDATYLKTHRTASSLAAPRVARIPGCIPFATKSCDIQSQFFS